MHDGYDRRMLSIPRVLLGAIVLCLGLAWAAPGDSQMSPGEHAAHHPGQGQTGPGASQPAAPGAAGEMGEGMGEMMQAMGVPPPKELYPSLMALPSDLPPEKRSELQQQAHDRMKTGKGLLSEGLEALSKSAASDDFAAMEEATARMRQGLAQFESGLAAHRALAEGRTPRSIALEWFRREMNLLPPNPGEPQHTLFGLPTFHVFVMAILVGFAVTMIWMYFHKMRRAA